MLPISNRRADRGSGCTFQGRVLKQDSHARKTGLLAGEVVLDGVVVEQGMKLIFWRERPSMDNARGLFFSEGARTDSSFPSSHSVLARSSAAVIAEEYPHRASAFENPVGTLGHHQGNSTHIANDVVTVGFTHGIARIEVSGFHGREPDEHRWNIDQGAIDSWSTRLTVQPGQNWSGQYSYARIKSPEVLFPSEDQERTTASVMYNKPLT